MFSIAYVAAVYIITLFSDVSPCFHRLFLFSSCELMLLWGPCVVADILVLQYHEIFNDSNYAQFLQFPVKKVLVKKYWKCVLAVNKQKKSLLKIFETRHKRNFRGIGLQTKNVLMFVVLPLNWLSLTLYKGYFFANVW